MMRLFKNILRLLLLFIVLGGLTFGYARYIEPYRLVTENVTIGSPYISEDASGLKIAVFADTHFSDYYTTENFQPVVEALKEAQPDVVFFLGDLVDNYSEYIKTNTTDEISALLRQIEAPLGKYAIFGNHDYGGGAQNHYKGIMEAGGFQVLVNEYRDFPDLNLAVIGIDDVILGYGDVQAASYGRPDYCNIVITHSAHIADDITETNTDLVLGAHTHGRQINLKFMDPYILPDYGDTYIKGEYDLPTLRNTKVYVTRGLGTTKLPLRFLSPPELTLITLTSTPAI